MSDYLQWQCDVCGEQIRDGDGHLTIDESAVQHAQQRQKEWEDAHPVGEMGARVLTLGEVMQQPDPVPWHAYHRKCDPQPEGGGYSIAISRIRNFRHALGWSLHLMGSKEWIAQTDWDAFIRTRTGADVG